MYIPFLMSKPRQQSCLMVLEDESIIDIKLPVKKGYLVLEKTREAWVNWPGSHSRKRGEKHTQVLLNERDAAPVIVDNKRQAPAKLSETIKAIARMSHADAQYNIGAQAQRDKLVEVVKFCAIILTITVSLVAILMLYSSGAIDFNRIGEYFRGYGFK